jgi:ribosome-associated protein
LAAKKTTATKTRARTPERPKIKTSHGAPKVSPVKKKKAVARPVSPSVASSKRESPAPRSKRSKAPAAAPEVSRASDDARQLATLIAVAALDKKAIGLEILDVSGRVDYADFLVLMTGRSDRQVAALASGIEDSLRKQGKKPISVEGMPHATWVLMDFGDVVVHVFQEEARGMYDIEGLWMDARRLPVPVET